MNTTATSQETTSASPTTQKMAPAYSPEADCANPTGRNPAAVISVPVSIGLAVLVQAYVAARTRSHPSSIFTTIISAVMMASSTSSPSAMISAPRVMRSRLIPVARITTKQIASTSGTLRATTTPVRTPSVRKLTASTMARASTNDRTNSLTDSSTTCGWNAASCSSAPAGRSALIFSDSARSALPRSITFPPGAIATDSPTAGLPLCRTVNSGGSSYPRRTSATSPSRNSFPPASTGTSRTRSAASSAPSTRTNTRSWAVSTLPAAATAFCLARLSNNCRGVTPSVASLACENSTNTFSGRSPTSTTLDTPGQPQEPVPGVLRQPLEVRRGQPVAGEVVDAAVHVAVLVVGLRAEHALGQRRLDVVDLLAGLVPEVRHLASAGCRRGA